MDSTAWRDRAETNVNKQLLQNFDTRIIPQTHLRRQSALKVLRELRRLQWVRRISVRYTAMEGAGFCVPHCPASSLTAGWRGRALCSRRRAGLILASANVTLDNERESSCSVINFDAPGQHFALRQVIKAVKDAGLNTTRISISTDDDEKVVKTEFLVTNGNGKLAEVDFEPIRSNLSSLPEEPASLDGTDDNPESNEYHIVEEIPVCEEDLVCNLAYLGHRAAPALVN
jgi:hypothetical protein